MKLRPPRTPNEKKDHVWEGIRFALGIIFAMILILWFLHACVAAICLQPRTVVKARPFTIEHKIAMMDEVYATAVERNYIEMRRDEP